MRKRVAIFANGWGCEYLREVVTGIFQVAKEVNMDVFSFVNFSSMAQNEQHNLGEINIFSLPDLRDFDGVVMMANSFNMQEEVKYVYEKVMAAGIPVMSVEYELDGITSINTDNYYGMYELANHVIREHGAKRLVFIGGPQEHMESHIRLQAVQNVANENGITLLPENILYGDWAREKTKQLLKEWLDQNKQLPDAFICANDIMAIGACDLLKELGYCIPDDVMVTGYDCIKFGQDYDPVISSVSHEWGLMGIRTMQILLDKMEGKNDDAPELLNTRFVCGESCGCHFDQEEAKARIKIGKSGYFRKYDAWVCDSHFRHIYLALRKAEDIETLHEGLNQILTSEHWMEGQDFMLCLEPEFFNIEKNDENLRAIGYGEQVNVIYSMQDGVGRPNEILPLKEAIFRVATEKKEPGEYIFVPLSSEGKSYGFAMLNRDMDIALENHLYIWTRHMNQYLEQVRRNITIAALMKKLTHLSVTDALTGVYNRAGCEKITYPMLEAWNKAGETGIVMLADIDRMKIINDYYGHASGDLALRIVAMVLKSQIPSQWIVARFGGDEFFIGGKVEPTMDIEAMIEGMTKKLEEEVKRHHIAFDLKMSIGYEILKPDSEMSVERGLQRADELMYRVKKSHHEEADRKK